MALGAGVSADRFDAVAAQASAGGVLTLAAESDAKQLLAVHAEGSIEAEKMQIYRAYEPGRAIAYARRLAGLD